jgi:hypothetical protein
MMSYGGDPDALGLEAARRGAMSLMATHARRAGKQGLEAPSLCPALSISSVGLNMFVFHLT